MAFAPASDRLVRHPFGRSAHDPPQQFIAKWKAADLKERAACQEHFLDLYAVLGEPTPAAADPTGTWFTFEKGVSKDTGGQGFADVWRRGFFGWEYKGKRKNLADAYPIPTRLVEAQSSTSSAFARAASATAICFL